MRQSFMLAIALCGLALPAAAAVQQIGSVNVSAGHYTNVSWSRFDGPVQRLGFTPDNDAVDCTHVTVNYLDGTSHDVFAGHLLAGQKTTVLLFASDGDSRVHDVNFSCKADTVDGARISLYAISKGEDWPDPAPFDAAMPTHTTTHAGGGD